MLHNQADRKFKLEIAVYNQKTTGLIELDIPLTDRQAHLTPSFVTMANLLHQLSLQYN